MVENEYVRHNTCTAVLVRKETVLASCGVPYHSACSRICNIRNIFMARTPKKRRKKKKAKEYTKKWGEKSKKKIAKKRQNETKTNMRSGRRPSAELTRLLFAAMIKPMICSAHGPTEGEQSDNNKNKESYVRLVGQRRDKRQR